LNHALVHPAVDAGTELHSRLQCGGVGIYTDDTAFTQVVILVD